MRFKVYFIVGGFCNLCNSCFEELLAIKWTVEHVNSIGISGGVFSCKMSHYAAPTTQKMKFSIKDFFSKFDQIRMWSQLLKKSLIENFIFFAVPIPFLYYLRYSLLWCKLAITFSTCSVFIVVDKYGKSSWKICKFSRY